MYDPETVSRVPDDYKNVCGISIGDVGVLSDEGEFVFGFNIFLPSDHPYNKGNTPNSFSPLEPLDDSEIHTLTEYFPRGAVITSRGIKVTRHSESPLYSCIYIYLSHLSLKSLLRLQEHIIPFF